jgi:capsular polysaccharide biosynthesis protein
VNEQDRPVAWPVGIADDLPDRFWVAGSGDSAEAETGGDPTSGVVTVGFLLAALGRRRKLWVTLAVLGLVIGGGLFHRLPPSTSATTTIFVPAGPVGNASDQINTDVALAQSEAVGNAVVQELHLPGTGQKFLGSYSVTSPSDQVIVVMLNAPTAAEATQWTNAVAAEFLKLRSAFAEAEQTQQEENYNAQVAQAQAKLTTITSELSDARSSGADQSKISQLEQQQTLQSNAVSEARQTATSLILTSRVSTQEEVQFSRVLNPAALIHKSKVKSALTYVGGGLIGGLVLGVAIVIVGALLSEKLRRRDDVAYALGAPVLLSVGRLHEGLLRRGRVMRALRPRATRIRERDMRRLVRYLRGAIPLGPAGAKSLAVVAASDPATVAEAVVTLATELGREGTRVLLADLSDGHKAGRRLGVTDPGLTLSRVGPKGKGFFLAIPAADDPAPAGPLSPAGSDAADLESAEAESAIAEPAAPESVKNLAWVASTADVVLSLVSLDPAGGGFHLATWATTAVAVLTAGESSALYTRSIAEMVHTGGVRLHSGVLVAADKNDESLGAVIPAQEL